MKGNCAGQVKGLNMKNRPLYQVLAGAIGARQNCIETNNVSWHDRHEAVIVALTKDRLPSGSGIDNGVLVDLSTSTSQKIVILFSFHHLNENGFYDGWTEHKLTVKPDLAHGFDTSISGRDKNQIKEYLYDTFNIALMETVPDEELHEIHNSLTQNA